MRYCIGLALALCLAASVRAQNNGRPRIVGQNAIASNEDEPVSINLADLTVRDRDDWFYPYGFTLKVYAGNNYTVSSNSVIPALNFNGTLSVPVTVNDGEHDSEPYDLKVTIRAVNDPPVITSQAVPLSTEQNKPVTIQLAHVTVSDPDNTFPSGFKLTVLHNGNNSYSVSGNQVTPTPGLTGTLSVPVTVSDGDATSAPYSLNIEVKPLNKPPVITGQVQLMVNEDESLRLQFDDLKVTDPDNHYPDRFKLQILPGSRYKVSGTTITPDEDFYGDLSVRVTVNDGTSESNTFSLQIKVVPKNDAPEITQLESTPLQYSAGKGPVPITKEFRVEDTDNDSLSIAEIGLLPEHYRFGMDELAFTPTTKIKGTFDRSLGLLTLSGKASLNEYIKAVQSVTYNHVAIEDSPNVTKTLFFRLSDGKTMSDTRERKITFSDAVVIKLDIPTAFTPNGDASNDTWRIKTIQQKDDSPEAMVRVYNRFGKLLFETSGFEREWDGRLNGELLPADTYYYTIDFGKRYANNSVKGIVAILR